MSDNNKPVSLDLESFDMPTYEQESAVWQTRAHELWLAAEKNGDLRGQASALSAAFRSLNAQARALQDARQEDQKPLPAHPIEWPSKDRTRMANWLDRLVAATEGEQ